jgi:dolichol-phosphate mannosyltransferase
VTLLVVLPTYNEKPNLERVAAGILAHDFTRLLVVDDASPDGTGEIADRIAAADDSVRVLHRSAKQGLGPAYVAGFRAALDGGAELVAQMDADFSHDPADLPRLLAAAESADLVLGSRYVAGGGVADWGPLRRAISRGGSAYARAMLGVDVRDLTGGFKVFRRAVLEAIEPATIPSLGYAFQVETTYRAIRAGFHVVEVPITFRERRVGASKMSRAIVAEAVWRVPWLRLSAARVRRGVS